MRRAFGKAVGTAARMKRGQKIIPLRTSNLHFEACKEALYRTRQVRRALGKEMSRVQRFFIATAGAPNTGFLAADHPGILVLTEGLESRDAVLATLGNFAEGDVFIADPLGNVVLRFPAGTAMKDMHQDLQLLLKASQIG